MKKLLTIALAIVALGSIAATYPNRWTTNSDGTSINGNTLTNVSVTLTNNGSLPGLVVGMGVGTNILSSPTNSASSLAPNFAGFGEYLLTTNASFTWLAPVGVDTGKTNSQYVITHITNSAASTIAMTGPAGVTTNGTWNVTNGGWTTISWHTYAGMITNALAVPIR